MNRALREDVTIMTVAIELSELDAHEQPSDEMRAKWKAFAKTDQDELLNGTYVDDPRDSSGQHGFVKANIIPRYRIAEAFSHLGPEYSAYATEDCQIFFHPLLPGLLIAPDILPPSVQTTLIERMIHRDLSVPQHQTNMHLHYDLPYPDGDTQEKKSFFSLAPESTQRFIPKDATVHKPLSMRQVLQRRLHWVTLGGQYDWTERVYPGEEPPQFPADIAGLLEGLFPETLAQAAIVNFYTPGDTMMLHRDVSENVNKGLISLSFGCDCVFMIAPSSANGLVTKPLPGIFDGKSHLLLKLRSGDALYMTGESRYAWHGVPKILSSTCPDYLQNLPAKDGRFEDWRGWMKNKRINLNVRQMRDNSRCVTECKERDR